MSQLDEISDDTWARLDGVPVTADVVRALHPRVKPKAPPQPVAEPPAAAKKAGKPKPKPKSTQKKKKEQDSAVTLRVVRGADDAHDPHRKLRARGVPVEDAQRRDSDNDDEEMVRLG